MNRRTFMSLAAFLAAPLELLKPKHTVESVVLDLSKGLRSGEVVLENVCKDIAGYVIVEDSGTFGTLTNGYRFKLAVREMVEDIGTGVDTGKIRYSHHLEGRFLCDPPMNPDLAHRGEVVEMGDFVIKSPSLTCLLRTYKDGSFKSNGPYVVSEEVAAKLRNLTKGA